MMENILGSRRIKNKLFALRTKVAKSATINWQRWHNPNGQSIPAFLVGSGRSGTNMLTKALAKSWQVDLYNEDNPAAFKNWFLRDFSVIEALIEHNYANLILFKPLKDTYRTPVLLSNFPDAKFIFIFRHYNDVINSAYKKFYDDSGLVIKPAFKDRRAPVLRWIDTDFAEFSAFPPPKETVQLIKFLWTSSLTLESNIALEWLFTNQLYFDLGLFKDKRVKLVQYEAVVAEPVKEFESLCHYLNLSYKPQIAKDVFSSSVKRNSAPEIAPQIQGVCEALWQRLCSHLNGQ
jgi:hypothetical protein